MVLDDRNTENQNILHERPKVIKLVSTLSVDLVVLIHAFTVVASKSRTCALSELIALLSQYRLKHKCLNFSSIIHISLQEYSGMPEG
jgi:hypothetical protein